MLERLQSVSQFHRDGTTRSQGNVIFELINFNLKYYANTGQKLVTQVSDKTVMVILQISFIGKGIFET